MGQLGKRLIASAFFVSVSIAAIFFTPDWFFGLVISALAILSLNEFLSLAEKKGMRVPRLFGLGLGAVVTLSFYFDETSSLALVLVCLALFIFCFRPRSVDQSLLKISVTMFGLVYVTWFFSHLIPMKQLAYGTQWVFYTILLVKGGDAGAYFVGKSYGRTKLIRHISPNKSVEGALGGFAVTLALSVLSKGYLPQTDVFHLVVLGILVGIISQLGDLAESLIKRDAEVKDSGVIPGLGGTLDVLDSLLLVVPFVFYYVRVVPGM